MTITEEKISVMMICPHCKSSFVKEVEYRKKLGLFAVLIKNHPKGDDCAPFIAFIDNNGKHRGSQKIDKMEEEVSINDQLVEDAGKRINKLTEELKFYHLKMPRKNGRGFEHKVASVTDRLFMSSKDYSNLIDYLCENDESNTFGGLTLPMDSSYEGGLLIYGKYLGLIFTVFWRDQKLLYSKTFEELKGYANLTVEQLIDLYDLTDLFF
jgi:hypothetical protein